MDLRTIKKLTEDEIRQLEALYNTRILDSTISSFDPFDISLRLLGNDFMSLKVIIPESLQSIITLEWKLNSRPQDAHESLRIKATLGNLASIAFEWASMRSLILGILNNPPDSRCINNTLVRASAQLSSIEAQDREVRRALGLPLSEPSNGDDEHSHDQSIQEAHETSNDPLTTLANAARRHFRKRQLQAPAGAAQTMTGHLFHPLPDAQRQHLFPTLDSCQHRNYRRTTPRKRCHTPGDHLRPPQSPRRCKVRQCMIHTVKLSS